MWQCLRVWIGHPIHSLPTPSAGTLTSPPLVRPDQSSLVASQLHQPRWRRRQRRTMMRWTCLVPMMMRRRYAIMYFFCFCFHCVYNILDTFLL
ncbi:hypothetical protein E2C01_088573 [Portunus trituberculatus]|uniref:Uncharacterized protein n=1 Tax=Portunus trituberculatus TaxID=210409 RepID=A0A5B7JGY1_PORTR|nr:hypothetical protein [Portunus trituberculatus]